MKFVFPLLVVFLRQRTEGGPPARTGTGFHHAFVHLYLRLSDVRIIAATCRSPPS